MKRTAELDVQTWTDIVACRYRIDELRELLDDEMHAPHPSVRRIRTALRLIAYEARCAAAAANECARSRQWSRIE